MLKYALIALVTLSAVPAQAGYQHPYFKWKKERQVKQEMSNDRQNALQKKIQNSAGARNANCTSANLGGRC